MTDQTDAPAIPAEDMPRLIALKKLKPSTANVRGKGAKADDEQLAADILAHGVLQNLVVTHDDDDGFEVVAGARRLRALKILEKRKVIDGDYLVPCAVRPAEDASEISLAENVQRIAMNPADEASAFAKLAGGGADPAAIASRFGVTERHVRGRLRLAELAPVVLDALRKGQITLDLAQAYASVPDPERQAAVFARLNGDNWANTPANIRREMSYVGIAGSAGAALFVGREAYLAAGGEIVEDLFTKDSEALWMNRELLMQLARDKLLPIATAWRDREGWLDVRIPVEGHRDIDGLDHVGWDPAKVPEADRDKHVVMLGLSNKGEPGLMQAVYIVAGAEPEAEAEKGDDEVEVRTLPPAAPAEPEPEPETLGGKVYDELAMQRRDVLRAALLCAGDTGEELTLAWMTFSLVDAEAGREGSHTGSTLVGRVDDGPVKFYGDAVCPWGSPDWDSFVEKLDRSWQEPKDVAARFKAFWDLGPGARADWQLYAALRTMTASSGVAPASASTPRRLRDVHDVLAQLIALDPAEGWRPTSLNYFDRIPAGAVKDAIADMVGREPKACGDMLKGKKAELSERAEKIAAGDADEAKVWELTPEEIARAQRWVPAAMRFRNLLPDDEAGDDAEQLDVAAE